MDVVLFLNKVMSEIVSWLVYYLYGNIVLWYVWDFGVIIYFFVRFVEVEEVVNMGVRIVFFGEELNVFGIFGLFFLRFEISRFVVYYRMLWVILMIKVEIDVIDKGDIMIDNNDFFVMSKEELVFFKLMW